MLHRPGAHATAFFLPLSSFRHLFRMLQLPVTRFIPERTSWSSVAIHVGWPTINKHVTCSLCRGNTNTGPKALYKTLRIVCAAIKIPKSPESYEGRRSRCTAGSRTWFRHARVFCASQHPFRPFRLFRPRPRNQPCFTEVDRKDALFCYVRIESDSSYRIASSSERIPTWICSLS